MLWYLICGARVGEQRNSFSYAGSSFSIAGIAKNVLKNRNTRFELEEVYFVMLCIHIYVYIYMYTYICIHMLCMLVYERMYCMLRKSHFPFAGETLSEGERGKAEQRGTRGAPGHREGHHQRRVDGQQLRDRLQVAEGAE